MAAASLVLGLGVALWALGGVSSGLRVAADGHGGSVVTEVVVGSAAWAAGAQTGMRVQSAPDGMELVATDVPLGTWVRLTDGQGRQTLDLSAATALHGLVVPALIAGMVLVFTAWCLLQRLPRRRFPRPFVAPVALAATAPLSLVPAAAFGSPFALMLSAIVWPLSVLPLTLALSRRAESPATEARARRIGGLSILGAVAMSPLLLLVPGPASAVTVVRDALIAVALLGPVALAAQSRPAAIGRLSAEPFVQALSLVAMAATPIVVRLAISVPAAGLPILVVGLWVAAGIIVARYVAAPLSTLVSRAVQQRDRVAAAAEAERHRLASDLHDGPLQSLTLLAYRLDASGDAENAELTRDVVTELRAITSALRLPVVDDLGAGPALEWLTAQVGRLSGMPIELERADVDRPPIVVEQAVFRIAQEALANATRHGQPPIRLRYEASSDHASLAVDDAGFGLDAEAHRTEGGHGLGLVGMQERAESIGAELRVAGSAAGSRVWLMWPAAAG